MRTQQPRSRRLERVSYIAMLTVMGEGEPASPFLSCPTVSMDPNVSPLGKPAESRSSAISCQHGNRRLPRHGMDLDLYPGFHVRLRGPHQLLLNLGGASFIHPHASWDYALVWSKSSSFDCCNSLDISSDRLCTYLETNKAPLFFATRHALIKSSFAAWSSSVILFLLRKAAQYSTKYHIPNDHARRLALLV